MHRIVFYDSSVIIANNPRSYLSRKDFVGIFNASRLSVANHQAMSYLILMRIERLWRKKDLLRESTFMYLQTLIISSQKQAIFVIAPMPQLICCCFFCFVLPLCVRY